MQNNDDASEMADQCMCNPLTEDEQKAEFEKSAELDKLNAYEHVQKSEISHEDANIIDSHVLYKQELGGPAKARIVSRDHRDRDKDYVRDDADPVNFDISRLIPSLVLRSGAPYDKCTSSPRFFNLASSTGLYMYSLLMKQRCMASCGFSLPWHTVSSIPEGHGISLRLPTL